MSYFNWPRIIQIMNFIDFFAFYILNSDISVTMNVMKMTFSECDHKVLLEGSLSQISYLGLSFYFIIKKTGNFLYFFSLSISTFDSIKTKTYIKMLKIDAKKI